MRVRQRVKNNRIKSINNLKCTRLRSDWMITLSRNPRTFTSASSWQLKSLNRAYNCALNLNPHILYPSPSFLNAIQTSWWPAAEPLSPFWSNFLKMPSHTSCPPLCSLSTCTSVSSGSSMGLFLLKMYASVANEVAIVGGGGNPWGDRQN